MEIDDLVNSFELSEDSIVKYGENELLPLCDMCLLSKMNCPNTYIREVLIPLEENDPEEIEIVADVRQPDGSFAKQRMGVKYGDGVELGIYKTEDDISTPFVCEWFAPKTD